MFMRTNCLLLSHIVYKEIESSTKVRQDGPNETNFATNHKKIYQILADISTMYYLCTTK